MKHLSVLRQTLICIFVFVSVLNPLFLLAQDLSDLIYFTLIFVHRTLSPHVALALFNQTLFVIFSAVKVTNNSCFGYSTRGTI